MTDMIDEIAQTIGAAIDQDWDFGRKWAMNPGNRARLIAAARAAITKIRTPRDAMIDKVADLDLDCYRLGERLVLEVWQTMVDELLND